MRALVGLLIALAVLSVIHEGMHAISAAIYKKYQSFHIRPYGFEVEYVTAVPQRLDIRWALISGASNLLTCFLAYVLLLQEKRFSRMPSLFVRSLAYWLTFLGLLLDPLNLSVGPSLYGGDANGIAVGLGVDILVVQVIFLGILLLNRELVAQKLIPSYGVQTRHPLLRPLFRLPLDRRPSDITKRKEE
jgi:hypothetical protein